MTYADLEKARQCHAALRKIFIHHSGRRNGIDLDQPPLRADDVPRDPKRTE